jgi:hypothetical protein
MSYRGKPIFRVVKEDSFYKKKKEQNEIAQLTHELLRALFSSLRGHADCYESHRRDLLEFFQAKDLQDQQDLVAKILADEMEKEK